MSGDVNPYAHTPWRQTVHLAWLVGLASLAACSNGATTPRPLDEGLASLPTDTGGVHLALPREPDTPGAAPYGLYLYLPAGLDMSPVPYPLLVFLHGSGERGDSAQDPAVLEAVLRNGPPQLIERGVWAPPYPMIVASPQSHTESWDPEDVRALLVWIDRHYRIDRTRLYLTGLSRGGYGTWDYVGRYGGAVDDSLAIAAAAPICGRGDPGQAAAMVTTPVWAFHGAADTVVPPSGSVEMVAALGALSPPTPPRLTLYAGVGHDSWSRTYGGEGLGEGMTAYADDPAADPWLTAYTPDLYQWFFSHRR
ncbi:MAG: hypothetical protein R3D98_10995 [Candidatus Krumholzibacteriia bacterium]